jgi:hypothetical protein
MIRFILDENFSHRVAVLAREAGLDVLAAVEIGRNGWTDEQQLRKAGEERRCLITRNYHDFALLTNQFFARQLPHSGVLFLPPSLNNGDFSGIAGALACYTEKHPGGIPAYAIDFLSPEYRIPELCNRSSKQLQQEKKHTSPPGATRDRHRKNERDFDT